MNSKPGSDTSMPSPNGVTAMNLLLLSSYLEDSTYKRQARETIDAFAVEIIQHPFLYVSMLSALVLDTFGISDSDQGFGRTLVKSSDWLGKRRGAGPGV